jgi:hypothetical protein
MRNVPMRWIEQAEERQVLVAARFEQAPTAPWISRSRDAASRCLPDSLRSWLAARHPMGLALQPAQPR